MHLYPQESERGATNQRKQSRSTCKYLSPKRNAYKETREIIINKPNLQYSIFSHLKYKKIGEYVFLLWLLSQFWSTKFDQAQVYHANTTPFLLEFRVTINQLNNLPNQPITLEPNQYSNSPIPSQHVRTLRKVGEPKHNISQIFVQACSAN